MQNLLAAVISSQGPARRRFHFLSAKKIREPRGNCATLRVHFASIREEGRNGLGKDWIDIFHHESLIMKFCFIVLVILFSIFPRFDLHQ